MSTDEAPSEVSGGPAGAWPEPQPGARGLPVVLALSGCRCLVVGGGRVGARRAGELAASGARVTVVAPDLDPALVEGHVDAVECLARPYRRGEASSYRLVVAATGDREVDRAVVTDALAAGVLVAGADGAVPGNLSLPAVHHDGGVTLAVSTGGASPALAVWLRTRLAAALPQGTATLAELASEARETLRRAGTPTGSVDWGALFDEVAPLVSAGRVAEARALVLARCAAVTPGEEGGGAGDSVGSGG